MAVAAPELVPVPPVVVPVLVESNTELLKPRSSDKLGGSETPAPVPASVFLSAAAAALCDDVAIFGNLSLAEEDNVDVELVVGEALIRVEGGASGGGGEGDENELDENPGNEDEDPDAEGNAYDEEERPPAPCHCLDE